MAGKLVAVAVIALVVALVGVGAFLTYGELDLPPVSIADTDAKGYDLCSDQDAAQKDIRGFGYYNDPPNDRGRLRGEVWSTTRIWYAWFQDGTSKPATAEARTESCNNIGVDFYPDRVELVFTYSEDGISWTPFHQDLIPLSTWTGSLPGTGIGPTGSFVLTITGSEFCLVDTTKGCPKDQVHAIRDGAALKVVVRVYRVGFPGWPAFTLAEDQVELRNAMPRVWWSADHYPIGSTAVVNYQIPTVADEAGHSAYFLSVINCNTNTALPDFDRRALAATSGNFAIPVVRSMFSNDTATCQNRLRAEVLSQLIVAALQDASVQMPVSIGGLPPPVITSASWDKSEYYEGDTATLSWKASGNVSKYHVTVDVSGLIIYDQDVDASTTSVSVRVPRTGIAQGQITALNVCQPSGVKRVYATVGDTYPGLCQVYPDALECQPLGMLWLEIAALVTIILAVVLAAAGVAWARRPEGALLGLVPIVVFVILWASGVFG